MIYDVFVNDLILLDNIFKQLNLKSCIQYMAFVRFYYEFFNKLKIGFFAKVHKIIEINEFGLFLCTHEKRTSIGL
jgi:hypothetical protein